MPTNAFLSYASGRKVERWPVHKPRAIQSVPAHADRPDIHAGSVNLHELHSPSKLWRIRVPLIYIKEHTVRAYSSERRRVVQCRISFRMQATVVVDAWAYTITSRIYYISTFPDILRSARVQSCFPEPTQPTPTSSIWPPCDIRSSCALAHDIQSQNMIRQATRSGNQRQRNGSSPRNIYMENSEMRAYPPW